MNNISKFQENMHKSVIKKIIALIIVGALLLVVGLLLVTFTTNEINTINNLSNIKDAFISLYQHNEEYLLSDKTTTLCEDILLQQSDGFELENSLRHLNMKSNINSKAILCDVDWNIVFTTFSHDELSSYLHNYNSAVCYNARAHTEREIYNAVYFRSDKYSDYMFVKPIYHNEQIIGFMSMYAQGSDWSYHMTNMNFDGVITDTRNNLIFFNKTNLITNNYKFEMNKSKIQNIGEDRYWGGYEYLDNYGVNIYSLIYYPKNYAFFIGVLVIIIMGVLWYKLANQMAASMAEKNAASIKKLVDEIRIIRKHNKDHRVQMNTKDEFEDVAYQINYMLDNINILNNRNTELLQIKNTIEINQLTAQINPHFLYNTLELIRNLVLMDREKAEELIVRLTQVLRYSINNSKRDVRLEEDMEYINDYLTIQKYRFAESLQCNINIEKNCEKCIIPKLLLQPIIENSIKYGFKKRANIKIDIKGFIKDNTLFLIVKDDCLGMSTKEADILSESLNKVNNNSSSNGLYNTARRLTLQYGDKSGIEIKNVEGVGLEVIIKIHQNEKEGR